MTDEKEIWCNECGVRMVKAGERKDIRNGEMKPIAKCNMCRKWEFVKDG